LRMVNYKIELTPLPLSVGLSPLKTAKKADKAATRTTDLLNSQPRSAA
jgi:hypothetical protein